MKTYITDKIPCIKYQVLSNLILYPFNVISPTVAKNEIKFCFKIVKSAWQFFQ